MIDGQWELVDFNPETGKQTYVLFEGETMRVREVIPVDATLEQAARMRADNAGYRQPDYSLQAMVPENIFQKELAPAFEQYDRGYVRKWLNNADNKKFRTRDGTA